MPGLEVFSLEAGFMSQNECVCFKNIADVVVNDLHSKAAFALQNGGLVDPQRFILIALLMLFTAQLSGSLNSVSMLKTCSENSDGYWLK